MPHAAPAFRPGSEFEPVPALICLEAVSKHYQMGRTRVEALRRVDLIIPEGQFVAVVGRSGSGKSTLLHLLAGMETPTHGEIAVGPWRLAQLDRTAQARYRRDMVGMIFQQFNLIPSMTALANVELPMVLAGVAPAERRVRASECLNQVGLAHRVGHRPTELSGGEQQRVAIARALVNDPPLLLADEPTGNLDSTTGRQIIDLLARVHREQGKTVVVVTHHPDEVADVAERVVRLHDGAVQ
jgi:putative ABC transport system ATP-binding protein